MEIFLSVEDHLFYNHRHIHLQHSNSSQLSIPLYWGLSHHQWFQYIWSVLLRGHLFHYDFHQHNFNGFEDETCVGGVGGGVYGVGGVSVCVGKEEYGGGFEILFDLFNELTDIFPL